MAMTVHVLISVRTDDQGREYPGIEEVVGVYSSEKAAEKAVKKGRRDLGPGSRGTQPGTKFYVMPFEVDAPMSWEVEAREVRR